MEVRKISQIAYAGLGMLALATPAFAQEGGGLDLIGMFQAMGAIAWGVAIVLFIMSFWSIGVAIERIYTFGQARKQSKLYAPQVAKHLKDGRLKEAIALSGSKDYRYSHLAKVVLAGLQEYQFQQLGIDPALVHRFAGLEQGVEGGRGELGVGQTLLEVGHDNSPSVGGMTAARIAGVPPLDGAGCHVVTVFGKKKRKNFQAWSSC
jgi:hypothetical protein